MKRRKLPTQERLLALLAYDPETGRLFWRDRPVSMFREGEHGAEHTCRWWNNRFAGREAFTVRHPSGYLMGKIDGEMWLAHRVIWKLVYGTEPNEIDHEDGTKSDNKLSNLRDVDRSGNRRNQPLPITNTSGAMGVTWAPKQGKWHARITVAGCRIHLGSFSCFDAAVAARKAAERELGFHANHGRSRRAA